MKTSSILTSMLWLVALSTLPAKASQPPADDYPGQSYKPKPLEPLVPLREEDYPETQGFVLGIYGPIAQKIYYTYAPHKKYELNYPFAPLSRIVATHAEGLSCYRRIPKYGVEQFRCNLLFRPAREGGEQLYVAPYTYGLVPHFSNGNLSNLSLTRLGDDEISVRHLLKEAACPRLSSWEFGGSNLPCAYELGDDVHNVYFPDDIYPQGVAVGWGVAPN